jgi:predicted RNA-binding Zn-ribbon protein involved in translation (DUF1610 family)
MTLLACVPCAKLGAFVVCADSQETVEEADEAGNIASYRRTVQKIKPLNFGDLQVVIAGSGNSSLIEGFIEVLKRALIRQPCKSLVEFVNLTEQTLEEFYRKDVSVSNSQELSMLVGATLKSTQEFGAWIQQNVTLIPIGEPVLEGWRETLYVKILDRVCSGDLTAEQAALAGIYVMSIAEATSNYVRGPIFVVVICAEGIYEVPQQYVRDVTDRLIEYEKRLNAIFLACADTHVPVHQLEEAIEAFKTTTLLLHRRDIDEQAAKTSLGDLLAFNPLRNLPPGPIAFGIRGVSVEHDREKIKLATEEWKKAREFAAEMLAHLRCDGCGEEFNVLMPRKMGVQSREFPCPKCGKLNRVTRAEIGGTTI